MFLQTDLVPNTIFTQLLYRKDAQGMRLYKNFICLYILSKETFKLGFH